MSKFRIIIFTILISLLLISCTPSENDISFELNPGNDTIELGSNYQDPGVTARVFGIKRKTEVIENNVNVNQVGTYYIVYHFSYNDIEMELTRIVTVVDQTPPAIELNPGVDTIKLGESWTDAGILYFDNSQAEITVEVIGDVDTSAVGEYEIIYIATDIYGNSSEISRIVTVVE